MKRRLVVVALVSLGCHQLSGQDLPRIKAPTELRVVLGSARDEAPVGGRNAWRLVDAWSRTHARGASVTWDVERDGLRLRGRARDGRTVTAWSAEPFGLVAEQPDEGVEWEGKRYRGELRFVATDTAIVVVNVVPLEEYLRGVVPLEIGPRRPDERAAVEAQAIAARSYTVVRALEGVTRAWDLTARATDQVYGGMGAEAAVTDVAIRATAGQVLTWAGQVVRAPYHAVCGGSTAAPDEVWQGATDRWLRSVDDHVPGSDRAWCDISPRYRWERVFTHDQLVGAVRRVSRGRDVLEVRAVAVSGTTQSGRARSLVFSTDKGAVSLAGTELRNALRTTSGEILNSTYFSAEPSVGAKGRVQQLTLYGRGNGHGVGMCQWGAIGRARAGMDATSILAAYYPGTRLARLQ